MIGYLLSIVSCACCSSVYLFWKSVNSDLLHILLVGLFVFFDVELFELVNIFGVLTPYWSHHLQMFLIFSRSSFCFVDRSCLFTFAFVFA